MFASFLVARHSSAIVGFRSGSGRLWLFLPLPPFVD